jgi:hypothetical protein
LNHSAIIAIFIIGCMLLLPQRAGTHPGKADTVLHPQA